MKHDPASGFRDERLRRIRSYRGSALQVAAERFMLESTEPKYSYNFEWLGRPIIQYPQDIVAMQEVIWNVRPDLIVETGIAHGGSLILSATMLTLLDYTEAIEQKRQLDPAQSRRRVVGVDTDIRRHNREAIEAHPLSNRIDMIEGSSTAREVVAKVHGIAGEYDRVLVCLDSDHTHEHVAAELEAYAPLVTMGSYCVIFDTIVEDLPEDMFPNRTFGKGNNPRTAVNEYLQLLAVEGRFATDGSPLAFEADVDLEYKLLITVAPGGYLKRVPAHPGSID